MSTTTNGGLTKPTGCTIEPTRYSSNEKMLVCEWHGKEDVRVGQRPKPLISGPKDAVVRITSTTICGSDLHMYFNLVPGENTMRPGDIMGHEGMGVIESVGPEVKTLKVGDRVVISAIIACGECDFCKRGEYSCCDRTNPSEEMRDLYGHAIAGIFGYSHLTGGFDGCQAEYVRVPFADTNCLKIKPDLTDEQTLFLSDILCTGWHGNELAEVKEGDVVCVWGAGPVGLATMSLAKLRGAQRVIGIDKEPYRLEIAKKLGCEVINFAKQDTQKTIQQMVPNGLDACIDCAGFRFPASGKLKEGETDSLDIVNQMIFLCRKNGHIALIGDYFGYGNKFAIGALMEKGITLRGGQVWVHKYWKQILSHIENGKYDPSFLISHVMPFERIPEAYDIFAHKKDNIIKVILKTKAAGDKKVHH